MLDIRIEPTMNPANKPKDNELGFGRYFTDHMFMMNYDEGQGWHDARIVPYGPISLDPSAMVLHYGQELFEGLKAYRCADGNIRLFRPDKNIERMNNTCRRMCVPEIPAEDVLQAIKAIVNYEREWVPHSDGTSLYIRPFIIATEPHIGVHPAKNYLFIIILSPVGSYYAGGLDPVRIFIERDYVRCVKGGTGMAKCGGNYAASLKGQEKAALNNCEQVLWLDGIERKYIDEVGAMNVFFVIDGKVVTPALTDGNILPGVTRASCIEMLKKLGYEVEERKVSVDEIFEAHRAGKLNESFGTGTAAVISPVGEYIDADESIVVNDGKIGEISQMLYDTLTGIQWGKKEDTMGWSVTVE